MQRLRAAREKLVNVEVTTLPLLAARLAGGFRRPPSVDELQPAIRNALHAEDLVELAAVAKLPGMLRAVQHTLTTLWSADVALDPTRSIRLADLAQLDARVRAHLPLGVLAPPDLRNAALERIVHAPRVIGRIELEGLIDVDPVWRPLVAALAEKGSVVWRAPCDADRRWFVGEVVISSTRPIATVEAVICADPQAEVVEALRWARGLMASGIAAADIGIAAASPETWDEAMMVLTRDAELPVHFSHGRAALDSSAGQACAALADVLLRGLSQARIRRLIRRSSKLQVDLPQDWSRGLRRAAGLFTVPQWRTALAAASEARSGAAPVEDVLLPRLTLLGDGVAGAAKAGDLLLDGPALALWRRALQAGPSEALEASLRRLRLPDGVSPGSAIAWGPARHLAAAPRPYMRLLGLTGRSWPRGSAEDPLLPNHVLSRALVQPLERPEEDVQLFEILRAQARGALTLSRSRRSAEGTLSAPSRLFPAGGAQILVKVRTPAHAFSEADRLLARPREARNRPALALARRAWRAWWSPDLTPWDGQVPQDDPLVRAALDREQSATSLRRLSRDPLGFVWRYALGWRPADAHADVLDLDRQVFGELVHELLRTAVASLEGGSGLNRATQEEIEAAVNAAAARCETTWPTERPVPPPLLWRRSLEAAARMARDGLTFDQGLQSGTRSWSEVAFGAAEPAVEPWAVTGSVRLGGLRIGGRIDRLDLRGDGGAVRVTDYKTGQIPKNAARIALAGGAELQRVTYAAAVRQLTLDVRQIVSRLVYLRDGPIDQKLQGDGLDRAIAEAERFVAAAAALLAAGAAVPGPDSKDPQNDMRLALPTERDRYFLTKERALRSAAGDLSAFWRAP